MPDASWIEVEGCGGGGRDGERKEEGRDMKGRENLQPGGAQGKGPLAPSVQQGKHDDAREFGKIQSS